ncbi:hypothetical protein [Cohnella fermenti]|uniref:Uncharacterized protein n=1 Tax=Cohnella fermenti TaxID=2565925 RepID=A0A4S4BJ86_9BACL|nr:hypothetical protein [Cohnella fermenti]THF74136.1 hypothetical protein E6C55_26275 [Cohnella fermenti]
MDNLRKNQSDDGTKGNEQGLRGSIQAIMRGEEATPELLLLDALLRAGKESPAPATRQAALATVIAASDDDGADALLAAGLLRAEGIRVSLGADQDGVRFAVLIGGEERRLGQVCLTDLTDNSRRAVGIEEAIYILEKYS